MGLGSLIGNGIGFGVGQAGAAIADAREKEAARQAAAQANSVDLEALSKMGINLPGVAGTGRVPNVVFDTLAKSAATSAEKEAERADRQRLATAAQSLSGTPDRVTPGADESVDTSFNVREPGRAPATREQATAALGGYKGGVDLLKFLYPSDKYTANARGVLNTQTGDFNPHDQQDVTPEGERIDLERGTKLVTSADSNGVKRTREMPLSSSDQVAAHSQRMVDLTMKRENGTPLSPDEQKQLRKSSLMVNTLGMYQQMPGAYPVPRGPIGIEPPSPQQGGAPAGAGAPPVATGPAPAGTPIPSAGNTAPQGAYRGVPPVTPSGEAEKVGQRNTTLKLLDEAITDAPKIEALSSAGGRGWLRARSFVQGNTPFEALSDVEQKWVTMHENLRLMLIESEMGLGPFRSPEMQAQLKEVIGKYWSPGTVPRLQTLRDQIATRGGSVQQAQAEGGARVLSVPQQGGAPPAAQSTAKINVLGPNGEKGTVPAGTTLLPGWRLR